MLSLLTVLIIGALSSPFLLGAVVLSKGTDIEVRLLKQLGSRSSKVGDKLEASVIGPIAVNNAVLSLQGSILVGTVEEAHAVGLGLRHPAAALKVRFSSIRSLDGHESQIAGEVSEIETARERVEHDGRIRGIDPAASLSAGFSFLMSTVLVHTELEVPALIVKVLIARSPNSEIVLPVGTEMFVRLQEDAILDPACVNNATNEKVNSRDLLRIRTLLNGLPSQRVQFATHRLSDLLNFALLGTEAQIRDAFAAAGWIGESRHSPVALYGLFHSLVQRQSFQMAPMSALTLNGQRATVSFQKSLNTIARRHHIRLWRQANSDIWFGAATEDIGFKVSRMRITHSTASQIDSERAKVINDLWFAGCVQRASLMPRDDIKTSFRASDQISTDGNLAVLRIDRCSDSRDLTTRSLTTQARLVRASSALVSDVIRSNPLTVGAVTAHTLKAFLWHPYSRAFAASLPGERVSIIDAPTEEARQSAPGTLQPPSRQSATRKNSDSKPPFSPVQNRSAAALR